MEPPNLKLPLWDFIEMVIGKPLTFYHKEILIKLSKQQAISIDMGRKRGDFAVAMLLFQKEDGTIEIQDMAHL